MAWNAQRSRERIAKFNNQFVASSVVVEDFATQYRPRILKETRQEGGGSGIKVTALPYGRAVLTDGVHIYANLMDFNTTYADQNSENEASQRRAMQFLHLHYGASDRLVSTFEIQRVDYHSARLHAVVLSPTGDEHERVLKAVAFANSFVEMVRRTNELFGGRYSTQVRIGIDTGKAVAINSGRRNEPDPLFVGSPANKAAHLAQGEDAGVFLSERVQRVLNGAVSNQVPAFKLNEQSFRIHDAEIKKLRTSSGTLLDESIRRTINEYMDELRIKDTGISPSPAVFNFHEHEPPLKSIDFEQLPPSNAIRMPMASIYADIDGYTAYIDQAIATGAIAQAVQNLHVIRGEFSAVLRDDFGGRKIRFIGDCIHGVIASGTANNVDSTKTVKESVKSAAAVRSSFELCKSILPGIQNLGLAIGIEYGTSPICRIGLRGDASVRCAVSGAIIRSEELQIQCDGTQTALGEKALAAGGMNVRQVFKGGVCENLDYDSAVNLIDGISSPAVVTGASAPLATAKSMQAHTPLKAHTRAV
ncbi:MAG: hypothetical protein ACTHLA_13370 [Asticcacaulis sp.]|uniref:hypothetical protein n=1 Tax=Asticcacaulis sp. TaxID=1872648 RepID=UPI003F7B7209